MYDEDLQQTVRHSGERIHEQLSFKIPRLLQKFVC